MLAALTGLRRGELWALRWTDVDLERGELDVSRWCRGPRRARREDDEDRRPRRVALDEVGVALLVRHRAKVDVMGSAS